MLRSEAKELKGLLERGGILWKLFSMMEEELKEQTTSLVGLDLSEATALAKAQQIQNRVRGGMALLDRMKEQIDELSSNAADDPVQP